MIERLLPIYRYTIYYYPTTGGERDLYREIIEMLPLLSPPSRGAGNRDHSYVKSRTILGIFFFFFLYKEWLCIKMLLNFKAAFVRGAPVFPHALASLACIY